MITDNELKLIRAEFKAGVMEAVAELNKQHAIDRAAAIESHIASCPVGRSFGTFKATVFGVITGISFVGTLLGSGLGFAIIKLGSLLSKGP